MTTTHIAVLGAGYSGLIAARRFAHKVRSQDVEITLVNGSDRFVERVRLHQFAANESVGAHPLRDLLADTGVRFVHGWASALDAEKRIIEVSSNDGPQRIAYDTLIYALGSAPDTTAIPGVADYTVPVGTEKTAKALRERLPDVATRGGRLLIVGGGLTGIESATELAETYPRLRVTLVTEGRFGATLSEAGRGHVREVFDRLGIDVIEQRRIRAVEQGRLKTDDGDLSFDLCLWAGPFAASPLAREAGLAVNARGQALVDAHLRSVSHPDIYVIGDAANPSDVLDLPIRMACATAIPMGAYVADDLAAHLSGKAHAEYDFAYFIRCISLGRRDGLIQFVDADDQPKERILTGRAAALVKEMVVRYAFWQVRNDRLMFFPRRPESARSMTAAEASSQVS